MNDQKKLSKLTDEQKELLTKKMSSDDVSEFLNLDNFKKFIRTNKKLGPKDFVEQAKIAVKDKRAQDKEDKESKQRLYDALTGNLGEDLVIGTCVAIAGFASFGIIFGLCSSIASTVIVSTFRHAIKECGQRRERNSPDKKPKEFEYTKSLKRINRPRNVRKRVASASPYPLGTKV